MLSFNIKVRCATVLTLLSGLITPTLHCCSAFLPIKPVLVLAKVKPRVLLCCKVGKKTELKINKHPTGKNEDGKALASRLLAASQVIII